MIVYLLKSSLCLAMLLAFYYFVLQSEKMHKFNRFYLLGSAILSLFSPFFIFYVAASKEYIQVIQSPMDNTVSEITSILPLDNGVDYKFYVFVLSIFVTTILILRFGRNLYIIHRKITDNEKVKYKEATVILINDNIAPHSFGNYIFVEKNAFTTNQVSTEIFTHELAHVTQRHSLDIVLTEVLQAIFWFNPLYLFLKKAIQLNHEFLADHQVLQSHKNITEYQYILLNNTARENKHYLASNFNYSLTKKRLQMMTVTSSPTSIVFKKLLVIPLIVGAALIFGEKVEAQQTSNQKVASISNDQTQKPSKGIRLVPYKWDSSITIDGVRLNYSQEDKVYKTAAGKTVNLDIVNEYKKMNKVYEELRNNGTHYIHKPEDEKELMGRMFSDMGGMWARMISSNRAQVKRPKRFLAPYFSFIDQNDKVYYKKLIDFTQEERNLIPPPPPPPPSPPTGN